MGFWSPMMQQAIDWGCRNGISLHLSPLEFGQQMNEKLGVGAPLNVYPDESAKVWLDAIANRAYDRVAAPPSEEALRIQREVESRSGVKFT